MSSIHLLPPSSVDCKEGLKGCIPRILICRTMSLQYVYAAWIQNIFRIRFFNFFHDSTALVVLSLLIVEVSRSHSVGILWTSDRPFADSSTWQRTSLTRDRHPWPAGSQSPIPVSKGPQTHTLDRAATGFGIRNVQISRLLSQVRY